MNFLFRTFVLLGAVVVLGLFAALLAPMWIDWSHYKDEFETEVAELIGQPVTVAGKTSLRLLPLPYIRFEGLEIGRNSDGTSLMTVEEFSLNAELVPLLSGDLQIVDIEMVRPVVNLQFDDDGQVAWTNPNTLPIAPAQIEIERLVVREGSGSITGLLEGHEFSFESLDAEISADSLLGPWRLGGKMVFEGDETELAISTGSYQAESKSLRVKLGLSPSSMPYDFEFNGPLKAEDGVPKWGGEFTVAPRSAARLVEQVSPKVPLPIQLSGMFDAVPGKADIPEYRLEVKTDASPYVVTGKGALSFGQIPRFYFEADGRQIKLEDLAGNQPDQTGAEAAGLRARLETLRALIARIPVPTIDGVVDVRLPAVLSGDTIIRDVVANVSPEGSGWRLNRMNALLPGNTTLETDGRLDVDGALGFDGHLLVASRQPTGLVNWMGGEVSSQIRGLKRVGLDAHVILSPNQVTFEGMELRLDDAVLTGKLQRLSPSGAVPAMLVEISGNRVDTDNLMALYALIGSDDGQSASAQHVNIAIKADQLTTSFRDIPIEADDVDAKLHFADGNLSIERLNASRFFDSTISSTGKIDNLTTRPNGNLKVSVEAKTAARLFGFVGDVTGSSTYLAALAQDSLLSENTRLDIELDATGLDDRAKGRVVAKGEIGGSRLGALLQFEGGLELGAKLPIQLNAAIDNASVVQVMRQFGVETLPSVIGSEPAGPIAVKLALDGSVEDGFETRTSATTGDTSLSFTGNAKFSGDGMTGADAELRLASGDLLPYLDSFGVRLPIDIAGKLPVSLRSRLVRENKKDALKELAGQLGDVAVTLGEIAIDSTGSIAQVDAELAVSDFDLSLLAEALLGRSSATNTLAYSAPEPNTSFTTAYYPNVKLRLDLEADRISIGSLLDGEKARVSATLDQTSLFLENFSFAGLGGNIAGTGRLSNNQGEALASANYQFEDLTVNDLLRNFGVSGLNGGTMNGTGSVEASGVSYSTLMHSMSGEGFVVLSDTSMSGFDANAFQGILAGADQNRFEANTETVNRLVSDVVLKSQLDVGEAEVPYSINRGTLRVRNVSKQTEEAVFKASLETSLVTGALKSEVDLAFLPDKRETYIGAEPQLRVAWQGDRSHLDRQIDASALEGYLSLRALEISQRRIETLEAGVFEKQRYLALASYARAKEAHENKIREQARAIAEEMARREAEAAEKARAQAEAARLEQLERDAEAQRQKEVEQKADEANAAAVEIAPVDETPAAGQTLAPTQLPTQPKPKATTRRAEPATAEKPKRRRRPGRTFSNAIRIADQVLPSMFPVQIF